MFIGHYGVGLALKKADKTIPLELLFLATQFVDILWAFFILLGIEKAEIVPGITAANPLDLVYYPYTHSLVASFLWAGVVYVAFRIVPVKSGSKKNQVALILGVAVLSHFFLDLLVHRPDLPLWSNDSYKIGLGLWNYVVLSQVVEALIFLGGLWIYLKSTRGTTFVGKYGMIIFAVVLLGLNTANLFAPPPPGPKSLAAFCLGYYFLFAGIAYVLDRKRN